MRYAANHSGAVATIMSPPDFNALATGHQVFLGVGANIITIEVTPESAEPDPDDPAIYTVTVNRAAAGASSDANLTDLAIMGECLWCL